MVYTQISKMTGVFNKLNKNENFTEEETPAPSAVEEENASGANASSDDDWVENAKTDLRNKKKWAFWGFVIACGIFVLGFGFRVAASRRVVTPLENVTFAIATTHAIMCVLLYWVALSYLEKQYIKDEKQTKYKWLRNVTWYWLVISGIFTVFLVLALGAMLVTAFSPAATPVVAAGVRQVIAPMPQPTAAPTT